MDGFKVLEPIRKDEIERMLPYDNHHTCNQIISYMVSFGLIRRLENGMYYLSSPDPRFAHLKPSLEDIVYKKYLYQYQGIRVGAYLLYKYRLTSQVSEYYEVVSNIVSKQTRSKKEFGGKLIVSSPKFTIDETNHMYHEFLELIRNFHMSDDGHDHQIFALRKIFESLTLEKEALIRYSAYYKGNRLSSIRKVVDEVICDDAAPEKRTVSKNGLTREPTTKD